MADSTTDQPVAPDPRQEIIHQGAVNSILAGLNDPAPQAPQYVPPVVANTSKWQKIITGAIAGLGGGLAAGIKDINQTGTRQGPTGGGYQYGLQNQQMIAQQQATQDAQARQDAQDNYNRQLQASKFQQDSMLNRARLASAHLDALETGARLQHLPQEWQDQYFKGEAAKGADYRNAGMQSVGTFSDENAIGKWLQQNGKSSNDYVPVHTPNGIELYENPSHQVDAATINAQLPKGYHPVPAGSSMNAKDAYAFVNQARLADAKQTQAVQLEQLRAKDEMSRMQAEQSRIDARELGKGSGFKIGSPEWDQQLHAAADQMASGRQTWEQVSKGMGTQQSQFNRDLTNLLATDPKYAAVRPAVLSAFEANARHPAVQGQIGMARTLFGSNGQPGTFDQVQDLINQIPETGAHFYSKFTQRAAYETGQQALSRLHRLVPDIAQDLATFQTGAGGRQTDSRTENALKQLETADTKSNLMKGLQDLRDASEHRLHGIIGPNPYLTEMAKDINPPSKSAAQHAAGAPAGATMKVPGSDGKLHWSDGKNDLGVAE